MKRKIDYSIYLVTDRNCLKGRDLLASLEEALKGGVTLVQLREKKMPQRDFMYEAVAVKKLCDMYNVPLIINDDPEVAKAVLAGGVHLGQRDLKISMARHFLGEDFIIGVSAHNLKEAKEAELQGADYLGVGALFPTDTKKDAVAVGLDEFKEICQHVNIPVVGIGGITAENYKDVINCGAKGCAMVSGILGSKDILEATKEIKQI